MRDAGAVVAAWRGSGVPEAAAQFARAVVAATEPAGPARARSLLWATSRLAAWGLGVGLGPTPEVLLHPSVIERFVTVGMRDRSASARRTTRTNLRFVARRLGVALDPSPVPLPRSRAKAPYSPAEIDAFFALAAAQPTEARRQHLTGLLCLGLGAGLEGGDLRAVTGRHVLTRPDGVAVVVEGRRARTVPVLARYGAPLVVAAAFAGDGFVCGGASAARKNLTTDLLDVGRLRSSWLATHLERLGLHALLAAAGLSCSQRLGDLARHLPVPDDTTLMALLGT